jgi:hypothetical protein
MSITKQVASAHRYGSTDKLVGSVWCYCTTSPPLGQIGIGRYFRSVLILGRCLLGGAFRP